MAQDERGRTLAKRRTVAFTPRGPGDGVVLDSDQSSSPSQSVPRKGAVSPLPSPARRSLKQKSTRQAKRLSELPTPRRSHSVSVAASKRKSSVVGDGRDLAKIRALYREARHFYVELKKKEVRLVQGEGTEQSRDRAATDGSSPSAERSESQNAEAEEVAEAPAEESDGERSSSDELPPQTPRAGAPPPSPLSNVALLRLGCRSMVKACLALKLARLIIEECKDRVKQRKAMQLQGMQARPYAESGDFRSVEDVLKKTARSIEDEKTTQGAPIDSGTQRLLEALARSAEHAKQVAALKEAVAQLAPVVRAIPEALAEIKNRITNMSRPIPPEEMKEVKKMLVAVVEAENVIHQTLSMQSTMQHSVRDMNAQLSEVGCIAAPMCLMGHDMVWRPVEKEGKVFCDRCAASRCAREGVIPYVWRCEICARDLGRRFHYCRDCGDSIRNEMAVQKCQPVEDWDYLVRVANEAIAETQHELGVEAADNADVADTLREIREAQQANNLQASQPLSRAVSKRRSTLSRKPSIVSIPASEPARAAQEIDATPRGSRRRSELEGDKRRRVSMMLESLSRQASKHPDANEEAGDGDDELAASGRMNTSDVDHTGEDDGEETMDKLKSLIATMPQVPPLALDNLSEASASDSPASSTPSSESEDSDADGLGGGGHSRNRRQGLIGLVNLKLCAKRLLTFVKKNPDEDEKVEPSPADEAPKEVEPPPISPRPPRPPRPRPAYNQVVAVPTPRPVRTEAEAAVAHLRKEVLALNSPRRPKRLDPCPLPHMLAETNVLRCMLPPLQPIKAYAPASILPEQAASPPTIQMPLLDPWSSPRDPHKGWKVSTLSHEAPHLQAKPNERIMAHLGLSPRLSPGQQLEGLERAAADPDSPGELLLRGPRKIAIGSAPKMDSWTPQSKVQGADPLAGGLFGRDASLDTFCRQRGLYQGQMVHKTMMFKRGYP